MGEINLVQLVADAAEVVLLVGEELHGLRRVGGQPGGVGEAHFAEHAERLEAERGDGPRGQLGGKRPEVKIDLVGLIAESR